MSKIIVPQELVEQIIELYQNGKTRKDIRLELKTPFGDSVIKRILEENDISIRTNPGAQKGGRKKLEIDKELQDKIIDLYVNKLYGLNKIVRVLNLPFSFDKVKAILKENNVHIRNCAEANAITIANTDFRKYTINDNYNLISHNGAWLLGFVAADGYLPNGKGSKNRIVISLSAIDRDILELIKQELQYSGPIYEYDAILEGKNFPLVSLCFNSQNIRKLFEAFGIVNNKTFKLKQLPNLSDELMLDFIRGYIDGDGSIYDKESRGTPHITIVSANKEFLEEINNFLHNYLPLLYKGSISPDKNIYQICWGAQDSIVIGDAIYNNDYLALPRKKKKYYSLRK